MKASRFLGSVGVLALSASLPLTAQAQDKPEAVAQSDDFGEIIVQARRVNESITDVPVAVTALSADALEQRNVAAVTDIQYAVPNLQIKPSNNYASKPEFIIRGQRQALFTDENVVTYVNGVPQSTRGLTLYDLQSVQALKGPQGTLFGKNSLGGAMVFQTNQPDFNPAGEAILELGNYNLMRVQAMVNLPVGEHLAARIAGQVERRDGVYKNSYPGMKDLGDRSNESVRGSFLYENGDFKNTLVLDYLHRNEIAAPSVIEAAYADGRSLNALTRQAVAGQSAVGGGTAFIDDRGTASTTDDLIKRAGSPFRVRMLTGIGTTMPGTNFINSYGNYLKNYGLANTTEYQLSDALTVKNIFGLRYDKAIDHQDPSGISGQDLIIGFVPPATVVRGQFADNNTNYLNRTKQLTEELQLIAKTGDLDLIVGGFYGHDDFLYAVNSYLAVGTTSFYPLGGRHGQSTTKGNSYALFGQGTYDFSGMGVEGLRLTLGGRYTWDKRSFSGSNFFTPSNAQLQDFQPGYVCNQVNATQGDITSVNNGTACFVEGSRTFKAFTYTASLEYKFNPDTLLYAATRHGFKAGGPNPTTRNLDFLFFDDEKLTDYEVGFKTNMHLGSVPFRFGIAGFIGKYKDIQTQDILTFCTNGAQPAATCATQSGSYTDLILLNIGRATIKVVEVDLSTRLFDSVTIDAGYSYQHTKYGSGSIVPQPTVPSLPVSNDNPIDYGGGVDISGLRFSGVPEHTFNVNVTYDAKWVPESFAKVSVSGNYSYRSSTTGIAVQGVAGTPSFGIFGARLTFENLFESPLSLSVWGQNITNERYRLYCGNNLDSLGYSACKWGEPATYGGTVSFKF